MTLERPFENISGKLVPEIGEGLTDEILSISDVPIDERQVDLRSPRDVPQRHLIDTALGEELRRGIEQSSSDFFASPRSASTPPGVPP
jgi:hypothetical protein